MEEYFRAIIKLIEEVTEGDMDASLTIGAVDFKTTDDKGANYHVNLGEIKVTKRMNKGE